MSHLTNPCLCWVNVGQEHFTGSHGSATTRPSKRLEAGDAIAFVPAVFKGSNDIHIAVFCHDNKILVGVLTCNITCNITQAVTAAEAGVPAATGSEAGKVAAKVADKEAGKEAGKALERDQRVVKVVSIPTYTCRGTSDWGKYYHLRDGSNLKDLMRNQEACQSICASVDVSASLPVMTWSQAVQIALVKRESVRVGTKRSRACSVGAEAAAAE